MVLNGTEHLPHKLLPPSLPSEARQLSRIVVFLHPWVLRSSLLGQHMIFRAPLYLSPPPPPRPGSILRFSLPETRLCGSH